MALQLGHNYIGTEHILLGLVREVMRWQPRSWCCSAQTCPGFVWEVIKRLSGYQVSPRPRERGRRRPREGDGSALRPLWCKLVGVPPVTAASKLRPSEDDRATRPC